MNIRNRDNMERFTSSTSLFESIVEFSYFWMLCRHPSKIHIRNSTKYQKEYLNLSECIGVYLWIERA